MADMIQKWQSGDVGAFEALFRQYENLVFRTAYLMTGRREEADDVLQEVFVTVWKYRHTFNPTRGKITTWLHRITVNQCAKRYRKREPALVSLEEKSLDLPTTKHQEQPEEALVSKWEYERLLNAMNTLHHKHRSVLVLRYFNDLSYDEIGQVVGIPLGTVKSRINQALKSLREQLSIQKEEAST